MISRLATLATTTLMTGLNWCVLQRSLRWCPRGTLGSWRAAKHQHCTHASPHTRFSTNIGQHLARQLHIRRCLIACAHMQHPSNKFSLTRQSTMLQTRFAKKNTKTKQVLTASRSKMNMSCRQHHAACKILEANRRGPRMCVDNVILCACQVLQITE